MTRTAVIVLAVVALGVLAYGAHQAMATPSDEVPQDDSSVIDTVTQSIQNLYDELDAMPQAPAHSEDQNRRAFLAMIAACEGTDAAGGYACLYGSTPSHPRTFSSFADHPRIASRISSTDQRWTTAAGRYQFMAVSPLPTGGSTHVDTWDRLQKKLNLPDFSPASQDAAALELCAEHGALDDIDAGRVLVAARKVRSVWASLPGAGYTGQPERAEQFVLAQYTAAGGAVQA